jgi:thioredoxin 1
MILAGTLACEKGKAPAVPATGAAEVAASPVLHLTSSNFDTTLAQDKPVLVDFWAPWCGPCRIQGPILETAAGQLGAIAVVGKINVDEEKDIASRYGVQAIPTLVILRRGKELQRFVGVQQADELVRALKAAAQ